MTTIVVSGEMGGVSSGVGPVGPAEVNLGGGEGEAGAITDPKTSVW